MRKTVAVARLGIFLVLNFRVANEAACFQKGELQMSVDSVAAASNYLQQFQVKQKIATALAKKELDVYRQQGDAVNQLLSSAAELGKSLTVGRKFDTLG